MHQNKKPRLAREEGVSYVTVKCPIVFTLEVNPNENVLLTLEKYKNLAIEKRKSLSTDPAQEEIMVEIHPAPDDEFELEVTPLEGKSFLEHVCDLKRELRQMRKQSKAVLKASADFQSLGIHVTFRKFVEMIRNYFWESTETPYDGTLKKEEGVPENWKHFFKFLLNQNCITQDLYNHYKKLHRRYVKISDTVIHEYDKTLNQNIFLCMINLHLTDEEPSLRAFYKYVYN